MLHYGQRDYDPILREWTQQDALDQPGDLQQANRYSYVGDDPVNGVDPSGQDFTLSFDVGPLSFSVGGDNEGFPVHGGFGFGEGEGLGASVSTAENGGGFSTGLTGSYCAGIYCGSHSEGFGANGQGHGSGSSGYGIGLYVGAQYEVNF